MSHEAYKTLQYVRHLVAFNVPQGKRRKLNQHCVEYVFSDKSRLKIYKGGKGLSINPQGLGDCVCALSVNTWA